MIATQVPFEINISVPKGKGKAASEGGDLSNTVEQAFLRDPDGYYIEICNCHLLTDFVLKTGKNFDSKVYKEGVVSVPLKKPVSLSLLCKFASLAARARRRNLKLHESTVKVIPPERQPTYVDSFILNNFIKRQAVYGDICQSFNEEQLEEILLEAGNSAPVAILLMRQRIREEKATRLYQPPPYYVNVVDDNLLYKPTALVANVTERGKDVIAPDRSAGQIAMESFHSSRDIFNPTKLDAISVNHIALIVSDVGKVMNFYVDVLGLEQVKRPNFDRHGAWFTGGNIEIHLILGNPLAPDLTLKGSVSNHMSLSVLDFIAAKKILEEKYAFDRSMMLEVEKDILYVRDPDGHVFKISEQEKM